MKTTCAGKYFDVCGISQREFFFIYTGHLILLAVKSRLRWAGNMVLIWR